MKLRFSVALIALFFALGPFAGAEPLPAAARQTVTFRLSDACRCSECAWNGRRALAKYPGVHKVTLSVRARRLDLTFDESQRSLAQLSNMVAGLDMGKDSALLWPITAPMDGQAMVTALARVPGVRSAIADEKAGMVLLTFAADATVSASQLEAALHR